MSLQETLSAVSARAVTAAAETGDALVPLPAVADEFQRNRRTLTRWLKDEALGFPRPVRLNGRLYVSRAALEAWKRAKIAQSLGGEAA